MRPPREDHLRSPRLVPGRQRLPTHVIEVPEAAARSCRPVASGRGGGSAGSLLGLSGALPAHRRPPPGACWADRRTRTIVDARMVTACGSSNGPSATSPTNRPRPLPKRLPRVVSRFCRVQTSYGPDKSAGGGCSTSPFRRWCFATIRSGHIVDSSVASEPGVGSASTLRVSGREGRLGREAADAGGGPPRHRRHFGAIDTGGVEYVNYRAVARFTGKAVTPRP
jgi:hypothetical protein